MPEPSWDTPARINGLPAPSRKRRAETTREGTMAEVVELWLQLADPDKRNCDIGWGPTADGKYGTMGAETIARYVERHKLPPQMAVRYQDAELGLRHLLRLDQPKARDVSAILRTPPTTPSQYDRTLAAEQQKKATPKGPSS